MKKYLIGLLAVAFVFTGCGNKVEEVPLEDKVDSDLINALSIETKDLMVLSTSNYDSEIIDTTVYYKDGDVKVSFDYDDFIYNNIIILSDSFSYNKPATEEYGYKSSFDNISINNLMVNVINLKGDYTAKVSTVDDKKVILVSMNVIINGDSATYNAVYSFEYGIPLSIELVGAAVPFEYNVISIEEVEVESFKNDVIKENYMTEEEYLSLINN